MMVRMPPYVKLAVILTLSLVAWGLLVLLASFLYATHYWS